MISADSFSIQWEYCIWTFAWTEHNSSCLGTDSIQAYNLRLLKWYADIFYAVYYWYPCGEILTTGGFGYVWLSHEEFYFSNLMAVMVFCHQRSSCYCHFFLDRLTAYIHIIAVHWLAEFLWWICHRSFVSVCYIIYCSPPKITCQSKHMKHVAKRIM
mgnify:CR=1 FL=1